MAAPTPRLVAIGNFDGVHRGHQLVLREAAVRARRKGLRPAVLTFEPPPAEVLGRGGKPRLTTLARKLALIAGLDPELELLVHPFSRELAAWSPEQFVEELLVRELSAREVVVGEDFRFGRERAGDFRTLEQLGARFGFLATAAALAGDEEGPFSSTRARRAIEAGDVERAEEVLGRPHSLSGRVVRGQGRARQLGFPTANLDGVQELLPRFGVYACEVERGDHEPWWPAVANIGVRPTLAAGLGVEVHLLDFTGDLYERELRVHLRHALREERRFSGIDALIAQIKEDVDAARRWLVARRSGSG